MELFPNKDQISFSPFPELYADRLILRRIDPGDDKEIFSLRKNEQVMKFLARVIDYGFTDLNLHSIEANVNQKNLPSTRLLEKTGLSEKRILKRTIFLTARF